jgi:hypothetical protein
MVKGMQKVGSRAQVMHGTAEKTSYGKSGLRKSDLKYNKQGKIVSKKMSDRAKREKRLVKAGYKTKKGVFGAFRNGKKISKRRSSKRRSRKRRSKRRRSKRRQRGGTTMNSANAMNSTTAMNSAAVMGGSTTSPVSAAAAPALLNTIKHESIAVDESGGALSSLE